METPHDETTPGSTAPSTDGQKFRRGGFKPAAEVTAAAHAQGEVEPDDPQAAAASADNSSPESTGLPAELVFEGPDAGATEDASAQAQEGAVVQETGSEQDEGDIRIGNRTFRTQKEAWSYAEELERERLAADAFRQGIEAAQGMQPGNPVPDLPPPPEVMPDEFYANPAKFLAEREAKVAERIKQQLKGEQEVQKKTEQTWNDFYNDYPDLLPYKKRFVEPILQENWNNLYRLETKKALKILAEKVREEIKPMALEKLPKQDLRTARTTASPGGAAPVTQKTQTTKPLNFVQQMKNLKTKRTGKGR